MSIRTAATIVIGLLVLASPLDAQETISRGGNIAADIARDGRVAIDLAGDIWIVPPGGQATPPMQMYFTSMNSSRP